MLEIVLDVGGCPVQIFSVADSTECSIESIGRSNKAKRSRAQCQSEALNSNGDTPEGNSEAKGRSEGKRSEAKRSATKRSELKAGEDHDRG